MLYFNKIARSCLIFFILFSLSHLKASESGSDFNSWLLSFKQQAIKKGISRDTLEKAFKDVKFLEQVIKYDRKQPEFFEDTETYVKKRANLSRANIAKNYLEKTKSYLKKFKIIFLSKRKYY